MTVTEKCARLLSKEVIKYELRQTKETASMQEGRGKSFHKLRLIVLATARWAHSRAGSATPHQNTLGPVNRLRRSPLLELRADSVHLSCWYSQSWPPCRRGGIKTIFCCWLKVNVECLPDAGVFARRWSTDLSKFARYSSAGTTSRW